MTAPSFFGQVYHTDDGKTVFFDPKTKSVSVFDGEFTIDKIVESSVQAGVIDSDMAAVESILQHMYPIGSMGFDIVVSTQPLSSEVDLTDILGPKDYYILVPEKTLPLGVSSCKVIRWISEHKKGFHPVYPGFIKHKILPEQFDWLGSHKECSVMAWYDQKCPAFVALACQDHAKIIQPVKHQDEPKDASMPFQPCETSTVTSIAESVFTEERDV
jgi:hypothetical protein